MNDNSNLAIRGSSAPITWGPGYGNEGLLAAPDVAWISPDGFVLAPLATPDSRRAQHYVNGAVVEVTKRARYFDRKAAA